VYVVESGVLLIYSLSPTTGLYTYTFESSSLAKNICLGPFYYRTSIRVGVSDVPSGFYTKFHSIFLCHTCELNY